jgi:hypothetical protein
MQAALLGLTKVVVFSMVDIFRFAIALGRAI